MISVCIGLTEIINLQMREYLTMRNVSQFISVS